MDDGGRRTLDDWFSLRGRVAVITGGGGELCGTMAVALGRLGARVAVLDLKPEAAARRCRQIADEGGTAEAIACNVLDEADLRRACDRVSSLWGAADILINGAGGNDPRGSTAVEFLEPGAGAGGAPGVGAREAGSATGGPAANAAATSFFDLGLDGFRATFDLNFVGTFLPTKVFGAGMAARGKGSIINMSSLNALTPLTKIPAYSAAKASVANLTRWLAVHFARTGVRVNALVPGFFMTEQLRFLHVDQKTGELTPRARQAVAHTPMGRYGEPEELLGAVIWLASDAASFVTGTLVTIDGGFSAYSI
jgi:NAD(P)-dependent dehydrogenase (short-subunit alcohol dehydrogenase family)